MRLTTSSVPRRFDAQALFKCVSKQARLSLKGWALLGLTSWVADFALAQTTTTAATERPSYIGASLDWAHDSNVFRTNQFTRGDSILHSSVFAGHEQRFGRQRLHLSGSLSDHRYQEYSSFDNTGHTVDAGLAWETLGRLRGDVRWAEARTLANPALPGLAVADHRNSELSRWLTAGAQYEIHSRLTLRGSLGRGQLDYSDPAYASRENTQNTASLGLVFGLADSNHVGAGVRASRVETPRYFPDRGDVAHRRDIDLSTHWQVSGLSTIDGQISLTDDNHDQATGADFQGLTGRISWDYRPTGRTRLNAAYSRDTGTASRFADFDPGSAPTALEAYTLARTARLSGLYSLSGKVDLSASVGQTRGSLRVADQPAGSERLTTWAFGGSYSATRAVTLTCQVSRESRSSRSSLSSSYATNIVQCGGRITIP